MKSAPHPIGLAALLFALAAWPAPARAAKPNSKPAPGSVAAAVPTDMNELSLRVTALEMLYEFDLTPEQLRAVRAVTSETAQGGSRAPARANVKLINALRDLHAALVQGDDAKISELKDEVDERKDDDDVDLDDDVDTTEVACKRAPDLTKRLKASQVAAYLALHAEEVTDPVEHMVDVLGTLREVTGDEAEGDARDAAESVGRLVAGLDPAKARPVVDQVYGWLKANHVTKEEELTTRRAALEESARRVVGDVPAMQVLTNWLDYQMATMLSNPQLAPAIDARLGTK